jgi:alkylated DNA repair dioxygenase AlkB
VTLRMNTLASSMNHFGAFPQRDLAQDAYTCNVRSCRKSFRKASDLLDHKRWHDKEGRYVCYHPGCQMRFKHWNGLSRHRETHSGKKEYECDVCKKTFYRPDKLKMHKEIHSREVSCTEEREVSRY